MPVRFRLSFARNLLRNVAAFIRKAEKDDRAKKCTNDLSNDSVLILIDRWGLAISLLVAVVLYAAGGWPWIVWGMCVRLVFGFNGTWLVNSVAHRWGYRNYHTDDNSRNNPVVALLTFGEGWHNNHHAQQRSAAHGMRWWELDISYLIILTLSAFGLVWEVIHPREIHEIDSL